MCSVDVEGPKAKKCSPVESIYSETSIESLEPALKEEIVFKAVNKL